MGERSSSGPSTTEGDPLGGVLPVGRGKVETVLSSTTQTATTSHNFILDLLPTRAPDRKERQGELLAAMFLQSCSSPASPETKLCSLAPQITLAHPGQAQDSGWNNLLPVQPERVRRALPRESGVGERGTGWPPVPLRLRKLNWGRQACRPQTVCF